MTEPKSYITEVRSFDHSTLAAFPAYTRLRQALSDLANELPESSRVKLPEWLDAVRDMALTAPYGDMCSVCTKRCIREHEHADAERADCDMYSVFWPHAAERNGDFIRGVYRCAHGHTWTCGYAVDIMRYL